MVVDRPEAHFIFISPWEHVYRGYNYINYQGEPLTNSQYLEFWGKWILFGTRQELDEFARKLDPHVESQAVPAAKYDRKQIEEFGLSRCVMCVYCHAKNRDSVWEILVGLGATSKAWVYEHETVKKWQAGGLYMETWIKARGMTQEQGNQARAQAENLLRNLYDNPDEIFTGVEQ